MSTAAPYLTNETDQTTAPGIETIDQIRTPERATVTLSGSEIQCLCPFCGSFNTAVGPACSNCHLQDTSETRAASKQRVGPWSVLQSSNPSASGMNFEELQSLVRQQAVTPRSVVRGPSTAQLWRLASKVRGLSREFGLCYSCGGDIETTEINCPHCDRSQSVPEQNQPAMAAPGIPPLKVEISEKMIEVTPKGSSPAIHVHTLSNPTGKDEFESLLRPIIAEQSERHIPKDDLLTHRDVAKAFQLEFGIQSERADLYFDKPSIGRRFKIFFSSAAALVIATALVWPLVRVVSARISSAPLSAEMAESPFRKSPVASVNLGIADARIASEKLIAPHPQSILVPANETNEVHPAPAADPIIIADPMSTASPQDDPTVLWNAGINAESNRNYAKAVEAYERIESLPSYLWPAHLNVRLELARQELKGEMH